MTYIQQTFEAAAHGWRMFMHGKRRSGRTDDLVSRVSDGDLIICSMRSSATHTLSVCKNAGKRRVEVVVVPVANIYSLEKIMSGETRKVWLDHTFVESYISENLYASEHALMKLLKENQDKYEQSCADGRPALCRNRLRLAGLSYPRSGCSACSTSVADSMRCPYES